MARPIASGGRRQGQDCAVHRRLTLLPFEEADSREAADIRAHLRRLATPIGPYADRGAGAPRGCAARDRQFEGIRARAGADRDGLGGMSDAEGEGLSALPEGWCWAKLGEVAAANPPTSFDSIEPDSEMPFIPMAAVAEEVAFPQRCQGSRRGAFGVDRIK